MTWKEQFKALKRWYYRIQGINGGIYNAFSSRDTYQEDFFRAFFILCYHLKDSLKNAGIPRVEEYVSANAALTLSGDIANYSKHLGYRGTTAVGQMLSYAISAGPSKVLSTLKITSDGKEYEAFQVANQCMNAWGQFLKNNSLEIPGLKEEEIYVNFPKWNFEPTETD